MLSTFTILVKWISSFSIYSWAFQLSWPRRNGDCFFFPPSFSLSFSSLCRRVRSLNANVLTAAPIVVAWKTWFTELYLRIPFLPSLFLIHVFWKRFKFFETIWTDRDLEIIVKLRLSSASLTSYNFIQYMHIYTNLFSKKSRANLTQS